MSSFWKCFAFQFINTHHLLHRSSSSSVFVFFSFIFCPHSPRVNPSSSCIEYCNVVFFTHAAQNDVFKTSYWLHLRTPLTNDSRILELCYLFFMNSIWYRCCALRPRFRSFTHSFTVTTCLHSYTPSSALIVSHTLGTHYFGYNCSYIMFSPLPFHLSGETRKTLTTILSRTKAEDVVPRVIWGEQSSSGGGPARNFRVMAFGMLL